MIITHRNLHVLIIGTVFDTYVTDFKYIYNRYIIHVLQRLLLQVYDRWVFPSHYWTNMKKLSDLREFKKTMFNGDN